jgi:PatG Domain
MTTSAYVYALGRIEPRFPRLSIEKEYAQATSRAETAGLTDRQALQTVLSQPENRYLARQLCYVLTIEGLDTYILQPGDPADLQTFIDSLRPTPQPGDVDVVVGRRGPIAPPELCNGLMVPIVIVDQIYSFDRESFVKSIPRPEKISAKEFGPAAEELFDRRIARAVRAEFQMAAWTLRGPAHPVHAAHPGRRGAMLRAASSVVRPGCRVAIRKHICVARSSAALIIVAVPPKIAARFRGPRWVAVQPIKLAPSKGAALSRTCPAVINVVPWRSQARIRPAATAGALTRRQIPITVAVAARLVRRPLMQPRSARTVSATLSATTLGGQRSVVGFAVRSDNPAAAASALTRARI